MAVPTIDRPEQGTTTTGATIGDPSRPVPPSSNDAEHTRKFPWGAVRITLIIILLLAVALVTAVVMDIQGDNRVEQTREEAAAELREEKATTALRDLRNRVDTEDSASGVFTEVFYVGEGDDMRARWQSDDGLKRCVMQVAEPTDEVLRYSTLDVPNDDAGFKQLTDPNAIGCLTSGGAIGIGGG